MRSLMSRSVLLGAVAFTLAGCAAPTMVGKWSGSAVTIMGQASLDRNSVTEFKSDGTFSLNANAQLMGQNAAIVTTGKYTSEGEKFNLNVTDVTANGKSIVALVNAIPQAKQQMNQSGTWKIEGDSLKLTVNGQTQSLTRVKE